MSDTGGRCPTCRALLPPSVVTGVLTPVPRDDAETVFTPLQRSAACSSPRPSADTTGLPVSAGGVRHDLNAEGRARTAEGLRAVRLALSHPAAARHRRHGRRLSGLGRRAGGRGRAQGHSAGGHAGSATAAQDIERRFKQELLLARQVTHKNVVRIHDLGEIDGIKYITMPYIEGADLATRAARRASCRSRRSWRSPGRSPPAFRPLTTPASSIAISSPPT